jgi:hypothetical protein
MTMMLMTGTQHTMTQRFKLALRMAILVLLAPVAFGVGAGAALGIAQASATERTTDMQITNNSARVIHLNLGPHGVHAIAPLATIALSGDKAAAAGEVLVEGVFKPLVDLGELVIDGAPKAAPPVITPTGHTTSLNDPGLAPSPAELRRNEPDAAPAAAASSPPDPAPSSTGGGATKRR